MNAAHAQIGEWLGVQTPATETEILRIVEGKLAPAVIKRLISLGLERGKIDDVRSQTSFVFGRALRSYPFVSFRSGAAPSMKWGIEGLSNLLDASVRMSHGC